MQTYKIFNDVDNTDLHNLFQVSHITNTRNACGKLYLLHCNTNVRKYSYTFRVAKYWNSLPESTKYAQDINVFKNLLDHHQNFRNIFLEFD